MKLRLSPSGVAGAALLIGIITVLARIAGFARTAVFSHSVTKSCLATSYYTANMIPNIVFEIVAGGALASMVVPVLVGPIEGGRTAEARRIVAAMLTWVTLLLVPLSVLVAVLAHPLMELLVAGKVKDCVRADVVGVGADMLVVFAPQIVLYGLAVVLYGVLQAHRRFSGPALAPLISSVVVIGAYLAYVPLQADPQDLAHLPSGVVPVLAIGTTLGVVALVATALVAAAPIRPWQRPRLRFPPGVAARVRSLALAGLATVVAQQLATVGVMVLSSYGTGGAIADYQFAWAVFLLPWAILVVPIATSAFPVLSAQAARAGAARNAEEGPGGPGGPEGPAATGGRDGPDRFDGTVASTTRAVLLASCAGAAALVAAAVPTAHFFDYKAGARPEDLARAIVAFAPGLVGYGLVAHLGRVLYACHRGRASAGAVVAGWLAVLAADVILVAAVHGDRVAWVVAALGLGNTIGMTLAGVLLLLGLVRARSAAALAGLGRAAAAGGIGSVAGGAAGYGVAMALGTGGLLRDVGAAAAAAGTAAIVFVAFAYLIDGSDLRAVLRRRPAGGAPLQEETPQQATSS